MVRTKANHAAARKAVAARAPRKAVGVARPSCSPLAGKLRKGKFVAGGNPAKLWPTPDWQKGIGHFLPGVESGTPSPDSSLTSEPDQEQLPGPSEDITPTPDTHSPPTPDTHSPPTPDTHYPPTGEMGGVALLDSSIAQLNSDEEDSD